MDDTRKLFKDMRSILEQKTPHTFESLIFGSESEHRNPEFDNEPMTGDEIEDDLTAPQVSSEVKPIIDQIRVLTIQGIAKLAKNPASEEYQLLKKLWTIVDKAVEGNNKPERNA